MLIQWKAIWRTAAALAAAALLACGGADDGDPGTQRGALLQSPPPRTFNASAPDLLEQLSAMPAGRELLAQAGPPVCGVQVHSIEYATVGAKGEATNATAALMLPEGPGAVCSGARPILLYGHGTDPQRAYNQAQITDLTRPGALAGQQLAATFAAHGYIVVAPNYAGYDRSRLGYHPYLVADQQSKDMIDALAAARQALPALGARDGGQLLLSGNSQGGYVALATQRALQAAGVRVTASAPMSGPYALASYGDAIFYGRVPLGSTVLAPLLVRSYQQAYGNIYRQPEDIYAPRFAPHLPTLLPAEVPLPQLWAEGRLPVSALFSSVAPAPGLKPITPPRTPPAEAPLFALGFGLDPLLGNGLRLAYLEDAKAHPDGLVPERSTGLPAAAPQHPVRQALKANDLRNWVPDRPVLLCGGRADPTVFFALNTGAMQAFWSAPSASAMAAGLLTVLDLDAPVSGFDDPFAAAKTGFALSKATAAAQGGPASALLLYHAVLVAPFCHLAARGFFERVLASGQ
ncbi:alpha/beta hydrolase family protein [Comamonas endophytica]|uniref:Alpha/beta hydrolase n=1 Tax=Comamonas endophytica TaxID=2949090 RepID=A0ABY6G5V0_9BURK|nr:MULTISPECIES: alpha/beta hydrolase [unclassified Acidovorax]MCD2512255.1 alpha/beta hydrolase [Acidovorax sp. D4N7]UYG50288.1 alpha/beta hydrolase [Acidovorax sp. 5MLIR]